MATPHVLPLLLLLPLTRAVVNPGHPQPSCPAAPGPGTKSAHHRLHHDLFCSYDSSALPVTDVTKKMEVTINVWLHSIDIYEYRHEKLRVNSWILMNWNDDYLTWDPNLYDGVDTVRAPADKIWSPIFFLFVEWQESSLKTQTPTEICVVGNKGEVECMWPASLYLSCNLQYTLWPFDTQICEFWMYSINDNASRLSLTLDDKHMTTWLLENPEWSVVSSRLDQKTINCPLCAPGEQMPYIIFNLVLKRRAAVYVAAISVPAFASAVLTLLPFLLPPSLPQRSLLAATGVLAHLLKLQLLATVIYGSAGVVVPPIVLLFRDSLALCVLSLVLSVVHRWLTATSPEPPTALKDASSRILDIWARNLSFARLQVRDAPRQPGTPAVDFWLRWTSAVDGCVLAVSVIVYVILLARFLP